MSFGNWFITLNAPVWTINILNIVDILLKHVVTKISKNFRKQIFQGCLQGLSINPWRWGQIGLQNKFWNWGMYLHSRQLQRKLQNLRRCFTKSLKWFTKSLNCFTKSLKRCMLLTLFNLHHLLKNIISIQNLHSCFYSSNISNLVTPFSLGNSLWYLIFKECRDIKIRKNKIG